MHEGKKKGKDKEKRAKAETRRNAETAGISQQS
jgi:hypothetical protein